MSLEVWFREDVARILRAMALAAIQAREAAEPRTEAQAVGNEAYYRGYLSALAAIAAAFGIQGDHLNS